MPISVLHEASNRVSSSTAAGVVVTTTSTTTGSLIAVLADVSGGQHVGSVTDSQSNTYTQAGSTALGNHSLEIWICPNATAGVTSVTVKSNGTAVSVTADVLEISGLATSSPQDGTATSSSVSATSSFSGAAITTTNATDLVLTATEFAANLAPTSTGTGWTGLTGMGGSTGTANYLSGAYIVESSTGTYADTFTTASNVTGQTLTIALMSAPVNISAADSGSASESPALGIAASDGATLAEVTTLAAPTRSSDAATLAEGTAGVGLSRSDSATLAQSAASGPTGTDAASLAQSAAQSAALASQDALALAEAPAAAASVRTADAASLAETVTILKPAGAAGTTHLTPLDVADGGTGSGPASSRASVLAVAETHVGGAVGSSATTPFNGSN